MRQLFLILLAVFFIVSCEDEKYVSSTDAKLAFSATEIKFDTVYSLIDNGTRHLKVYNQYDQIIKISMARLAMGDRSPFRLNINGNVTNEVFDFEIPPLDSVYIFVEVVEDIDSLSFILKDSIEFLTNTNYQKVNLKAWKQNVNLISNDIEISQTWSSERPYLVTDKIEVAPNTTLKILQGTKIYFQEGSGLYVWGKLIAKGSMQYPIIFQGTKPYGGIQDDISQWNGILFFSGSHDNELDFIEVKNANIALQVGNIENEGYASAVIGNSKIYSNTYAGIFAVKSKIRGYNVLISDFGLYGIALLVGGEYEFLHTTVAGYNDDIFANPRNTPALLISDHVIIEKNSKKITYQGEMKKAFFANTIVAGNIISGNEIKIGEAGDRKMNFRFDHCFLQLADTFDISNGKYYNKIIKGGNPGFIAPYKSLNFELDTLSIVRDAGLEEISTKYPFDLKMTSRIVDDAPDLGVYEQVGKIK